MTTADAIVLTAVGVVAGAANTLAGGGSSVTLPLLLDYGLTAPVANGTNHLAHLAGAVGRLLVFARSNVWNWRLALAVALPTVLGAMLGTWLATVLEAGRLRPLILIALLVAAVLLVLNPKRLLHADGGRPPHVGPVQVVLLALIGAWAGFVIVGAGTFLLLVLVLSVGLALTEALAVNALISFLAMTASAWLFVADGSVDVPTAVCLAAGTVLGSALTARLALSGRAKVWLYWLVVALAWSEALYLLARELSAVG